MSSHRFLAVDLVTGTIRDEVPLTSVTFGKRLNGPAPFTATASPYAAKVTPANLDPGRTLIVVERNGKVVGDGIVWTPSAGRQDSERTLELSGASLWSYLNRRRIREDRTYTDVDDALIVADLVAWAQGAGSLTYGPTSGDPTGDVGIDTSGIVAAGTTSTRTYLGDERPSLGEELSAFASIEDVSVSIDVSWDGSSLVRDLVVVADRGVRLADAFVLGTNVVEYEVAWRGDLLETTVDAVGQGEGSSMLVSTAADPSAHPSYPRLDGIESRKSVRRTATLTRHAEERLRRHRRPPAIPKLKLDPDAIPTFGSWQLEDEARVVIDDGYTQVDGTYRIVAWEMELDADGSESVSITLETL